MIYTAGFQSRPFFKLLFVDLESLSHQKLNFSCTKKKNLFAVSREILTLNILTRENFLVKTIQKKKELWYKIVYLIFTTLLAATILVALATSKMLVSKFVRPVANLQTSI